MYTVQRENFERFTEIDSLKNFQNFWGGIQWTPREVIFKDFVNNSYENILHFHIFLYHLLIYALTNIIFGLLIAFFPFKRLQKSTASKCLRI